MQIVYIRENLQEMLPSIFREKWEKCFHMSSAENFTQNA